MLDKKNKVEKALNSLFSTPRTILPFKEKNEEKSEDAKPSPVPEVVVVKPSLVESAMVVEEPIELKPKNADPILVEPTPTSDESTPSPGISSPLSSPAPKSDDAQKPVEKPSTDTQRKLKDAKKEEVVGHQQVVAFILAGEYYGVDIAFVESIIKMQLITALPHASDHVVGVTNLRGTVLPVFDLRKRFGLLDSVVSKDHRIIVVAVAKEKVGVIVDAVSEVLSIPKADIEPPPPIVTTIDTEFIIGVAKVDNRLVKILDLEKAITR